jgi:cytochrome c peroxidase
MIKEIMGGVILKIFILVALFTSFCFADGLIQPLEPVLNIDTKKASLGKLLFFDPSLSKDETISCASCHKSEHGWADDKAISEGVYNRKGKINSPTVLNAVYNFKQFWNGRVDTLKEQAKGPLHNSFEMDMDDTLVEKRVNSNTMYKEYFKEIYKSNTITFDNVLDAIAEYEKTLTTEDSKFDLYLKGKTSLTEKEKRGYESFRTFGCITCHNGMNVGGNSFQKMGIVIPYNNCVSDRFEVTKREFDTCVYKVPTLRNISKTAPYFHDGSAETLQDAIKTMAFHNLGFEPEKEEVEEIEMFLKTLDADIKEIGVHND